MNKYFSVKNWDSFQHYKDRNPPWIKLHNSLLDNYEFECLPDASKAHLLCIWMLASRTNNKMVFDNAWVKRKIGSNSAVDLQLLESAGFIELQGMEQDASKVLVSEEERQRRGEEIPYQLIVDAYHEILPELSSVVKLTPERKKSIKARWHSGIEGIQDINWWKDYFNYIRKLDFLMGRKKDWIANFDFIIGTKLLKIVEGGYEQ